MRGTFTCAMSLIVFVSDSQLMLDAVSYLAALLCAPAQQFIEVYTARMCRIKQSMKGFGRDLHDGDGNVW